jgi:hypothetical protein
MDFKVHAQKTPQHTSKGSGCAVLRGAVAIAIEGAEAVIARASAKVAATTPIAISRAAGMFILAGFCDL